MKHSHPIRQNPVKSPFTGDTRAVLPAAGKCAESPQEHLMPFGKAAKAIFVKANGLPAYRKSIGIFRYAD